MKSGRSTEGELSNFELGGGLLTWDTGHSAVNFEPNEETSSSGTLSSYRPSNGKRRTWKLPRLSINRGQDDESPGVCGYSAHTANTVFWIATRFLVGAGEEGGAVGVSSVYAAPWASAPILASGVCRVRCRQRSHASCPDDRVRTTIS
jgi:hypothetical protein